MYKHLVYEIRAYAHAIEATTEKDRVVQHLKDLAKLARIHSRLLEKETK